MITFCKVCNKSINDKPSRKREYCSRKCVSITFGPNNGFQKGHPPTSGCFKKGCTPKMKDETHYAWKGDEVSLRTLHQWIGRKLGKPSKCEHCGTTEAKKFEWANKSRQYKRDLTDWIRLCTQCHHKYDDSKRKSWVTRKLNILEAKVY